MKNKNSKALLSLYLKNEELFIQAVRKGQAVFSVSIETYIAEKKFKKYEEQLLMGIKEKSEIYVSDAIVNLRSLYSHKGIEPTPDKSGRYNMLHFLLEIEEVIVIISNEWPKNKRNKN